MKVSDRVFVSKEIILQNLHESGTDKRWIYDEVTEMRSCGKLSEMLQL